MARMTSARDPRWLGLTGLLVLVTAGLVWLMFGLAGDWRSRRPLPDGSGSSVALLTDQRDTLTPADVRAEPAAAWRPWTGGGFVPGAKVAWVAVTLRNPTAAPRAGVLADAVRYADHVDLYYADETEPGGWRHLRAGEWVPTREKAIPGRENAFPLWVPARGERTVYVRYEDRLAIWLELDWWPEAGAFYTAMGRDGMAEAACFGLLLALLLYHTAVWLRLRFAHTGYYLLYVAAFIVYLFGARSGVTALGEAFGSPWMELIGSCAMPASGALLAEFGRRFLGLAQRAPRADRAALHARTALTVLAVLAVLAAVTGHGRWLGWIVLTGAISHLVLLGALVAVWRLDGWRPRYLVLGLGSVLAGLLPAAVAVAGAPLEFFSRVAMVGAVMELLLLSLAVGERLADLQREKTAAQERAVAEAEKRQAMQEAYADELEHEVRERTRELAAANADKDRMMAVLGHDLRSPLTALTLAAEHAEPRDGFAADAAQTGRKLLLLLEDVVLWARLRAGGGRAVEQAAASVVAPAADLHQALAAQRGVTLAIDVSPDLRVRTDLVPAQTLVRNLVSNAVKSARRRVTVTVQPATAAPDAEALVRIGVRDDGAGLPSGAIALLRGEMAERDTRHPWGMNSGLGLRLCVEIAQALGTRLEVATSADGGTEISFTLARADR
jgi:signal transduction histidine kinase